jgi:hypothetical protein
MYLMLFIAPFFFAEMKWEMQMPANVSGAYSDKNERQKMEKQKKKQNHYRALHST